MGQMESKWGQNRAYTESQIDDSQKKGAKYKLSWTLFSLVLQIGAETPSPRPCKTWEPDQKKPRTRPPYPATRLRKTRGPDPWKTPIPDVHFWISGSIICMLIFPRLPLISIGFVCHPRSQTVLYSRVHIFRKALWFKLKFCRHAILFIHSQ